MYGRLAGSRQRVDVPGESGNASGRRVGFQDALGHRLTQRRCGDVKRSFRFIDLLLGDRGLNLSDQALDRAERGTVSGLALFRLAGSSNRRLMDDWHSKLLYKRNALVA